MTHKHIVGTIEVPPIYGTKNSYNPLSLHWTVDTSRKSLVTGAVTRQPMSKYWHEVGESLLARFKAPCKICRTNVMDFRSPLGGLPFCASCWDELHPNVNPKPTVDCTNCNRTAVIENGYVKCGECRAGTMISGDTVRGYIRSPHLLHLRFLRGEGYIPIRTHHGADNDALAVLDGGITTVEFQGRVYELSPVEYKGVVYDLKPFTQGEKPPEGALLYTFVDHAGLVLLKVGDVFQVVPTPKKRGAKTMVWVRNDKYEEYIAPDVKAPTFPLPHLRTVLMVPRNVCGEGYIPIRSAGSDSGDDWHDPVTELHTEDGFCQCGFPDTHECR